MDTVLWDITPCSLVELTDDSEEHNTSIFMVEGKEKQAVFPNVSQ
jgi:hypothetical protein